MILVTGATGTIGRPLIEALSAAGADIRAVTRKGQAAGLPAHVEVVAGDPSRPDTIARALRGVSALFLHPRAVGDAAFDLAALAREQGVRRIVALSAMNIDDPLDQQPSRFRGDRNKEAVEHRSLAPMPGPLLWISIQTRVAVALGIVFLMTVKPDLNGSLLAIAVAAILGLVAALPAVTSGGSKQSTT